MQRALISSGSTFEVEIGYSRAVVQGDWVFVSGTAGFIEAAISKAGACLRDVVPVTHVLPHVSDFPMCWPVLRKYFGKVRSAAMMISAGLSDPRMQIEIQVSALKHGA